LPVDAQIWTEADVAHDGLNLETILDQMNSRGAAIKIALLDASRRNPFERRFRRYSAGLAAAVTPTDTLVLYSAAVGSVVSNSRNDHSLFVTELLEEIRTPSVSAEQALRNTQAGVSSATNREQVPWLSSSLTSEFSFSGGPIRPFDNGIGQSQSEAETGKPVCELPKPLDPRAADDMANNPRVKEMSSRIAADRNDRIAYYKRGQVYTNKRAYALAVQNFGNAIRLDATDAEAYNNRCWTRAVLGDLQAALKDCDKALQLDPGLPSHWIGHGQSEARQTCRCDPRLLAIHREESTLGVVAVRPWRSEAPQRRRCHRRPGARQVHRSENRRRVCRLRRHRVCAIAKGTLPSRAIATAEFCIRPMLAHQP
jgi:hypothetical protein